MKGPRKIGDNLPGSFILCHDYMEWTHSMGRNSKYP